MTEKSNQQKTTSWENVSNWYDQIVSKEGHYYHQEVIFPYLESAIFKTFKKDAKILELACGQGVLERKLKKEQLYIGLDLSPHFIRQASKQKISDQHQFIEQDVTEPFQLKEQFDHAFIILALQNFKNPEGAIKNISAHLKNRGSAVLVLNHPCFRIPRQSSWGIDKERKIQYRRIDRYMSNMEIPIAMQPSKGSKTETTYSYHNPLTFFSELFSKHHLMIKELKELCSNKKSEGGSKKMEDRARDEFPLFIVMTLEKVIP